MIVCRTLCTYIYIFYVFSGTFKKSKDI